MKRITITTALLFLISTPCFADIISVTTRTADIVSIPTAEASYVVLRVPLYYPLSYSGESKNNFLHVEDFQGRQGWIHESSISDAATVVVTGNNVNIRRGPATNTPTLFKAKKGVAFSLIQQQGNWLEVKHESGRKGWIYKDLTWGGTAPAE